MLPFPNPEYNAIADQVLELSPHLLPDASASTIIFPDSFHDLLFHSDVSLPQAASLPAVRPTPESAQPAGRSRRKRSTRKGRHSKICTAKGPRDRRMRLSIGVAQKFFKLQDMLGFDKASKTVQWLLTMSKAAIKELADISSSSKTICSFLGDQLRSPKSDSSTLTGSKDISKSAPGESMKKAKKDCSVRSTKKALAAAQLHSAKAREMRAKARERARERTREKQKMMTYLCSADEGKIKAELSLKDLKALLELANSKEEAIESSSYQCLNPINNSTCNDMFQQDYYWEMDGFSSSYVPSSMAAFSISYPNL